MSVRGRQLCNSIGGVSEAEPNGSYKRLGEALDELIEGCILPRQERFSGIAEVWDGFLPEELSRHCRICDIKQGELKVMADSSSYRYELELRSLSVLNELQRRCPGAKIRRIRVSVG